MATLNYIVTVVFALSLIFNLMREIANQKRRIAFLNAEVRYLFEKTGVVYEPIAILTPSIRKAVADGKKIEAIKLYRDATGSSLKKSKLAVEEISS